MTDESDDLNQESYCDKMKDWFALLLPYGWESLEITAPVRGKCLKKDLLYFVLLCRA